MTRRRQCGGEAAAVWRRLLTCLASLRLSRCNQVQLGAIRLLTCLASLRLSRWQSDGNPMAIR